MNQEKTTPTSVGIKPKKPTLAQFVKDVATYRDTIKVFSKVQNSRTHQALKLWETIVDNDLKLLQ